MKHRLAAALCLVTLLLAGCAAGHHVPMADEAEAWGYDFHEPGGSYR